MNGDIFEAFIYCILVAKSCKHKHQLFQDNVTDLYDYLYDLKYKLQYRKKHMH